MTRKELIAALTAPFRKDSPWYAEDCETTAQFVNNMTPAQFAETSARHRAISAVTESEIRINCQV